jgi:hypothetical protein
VQAKVQISMLVCLGLAQQLRYLIHFIALQVILLLCAVLSQMRLSENGLLMMIDPCIVVRRVRREKIVRHYPDVMSRDVQCR